MKKFLTREDFKYVVRIDNPHDGHSVRDWVVTNNLPYIYNTTSLKWTDYIFTEESHAVVFKLRWL